MKKIIFVLLDGLGGLPAKRNKTELEIAKTPTLDGMMKEGVYGLMYPIDMGIIPGSDTSQLNILGYPPEKYYPGRGPLEALGIGMKIKEGDVAFRANFATVDEKFNVIDRRAGRIKTEDASELSESIEYMKIDGLEFIFKNSVEHRGAVIVRGNGITDNVEDTDPHKTGVKVRQPKITKSNAKIVRAINKYTSKIHRILREHPLNKKRKIKANIVLLRGAGRFRKVEPFEKRMGMKAVCIAGAALYKGIAKYVGMDVIHVKGATGTYNTDLKAKAKTAIRALKDYDFVYLHVKATDNAGHDGDLGKRVKMLEKIDKMMRIIKRNAKDAVIIITGDHSTPVIKREHSFEPVPFLITNINARKYGAKSFCEIECKKGELGLFKGEYALKLAKAYAGRIKKYGE